MYLFLTSIIFFVFTLLILIKFSKYISLVDVPNERKIHKKPIPIVGGIAIFLTLYFFSFFLNINNLLSIIIFSSFFILCIGILDDIFHLQPKYRIIFQFSITLYVVYSGIYIHDIGQYLLINQYELGFIGIFLTFFSVMCLINAINFIDGIDGLATGIIIAILSNILILIFLDATLFEINFIYLLLTLLIVFLFFNLGLFNRYKVFLGDAGSTTLGFLIAFLLVYFTLPENRLFHPVLAIWIVALPMFDLLNVIIKRIFLKKNISLPDKYHIHHILMKLKFTQKQTLILLILTSIVLNLYGYYSYSLLSSDVSLLSFPILYLFYFFVLKKLDQKVNRNN